MQIIPFTIHVTFYSYRLHNIHSPYSSASIATRIWTADWEISNSIPGRRSDFYHRTDSRSALGTIHLYIRWIPATISLAAKQTGIKAEYLPSPSSEVKNGWSPNSIPPFQGVMLNWAWGYLSVCICMYQKQTNTHTEFFVYKRENIVFSLVVEVGQFQHTIKLENLVVRKVSNNCHILTLTDTIKYTA
jgi:hypothetical protein